jgi:hypothetical protein
MTDDNFARTLISEKLRDVYSVWKTLSAGRVGPKRSEISLSSLRRAAPWAFTVDVIDSGKDFRVGFRGDRIDQFMGDRCTAPLLSGMLGTYFFDDADRMFRECVTAARPLLSGPRQTKLKGKEHLEREVVLLPLSEDGVTVTGILGAFDTWQLGTHGRTTQKQSAQT